MSSLVSGSYFNEDTIVAVATAPNASAALGVVRISGKNTWNISEKILRKTSGRASFKEEEIESHKLYRCLLVKKDGSALDDGMFVWMKAPASFTGEDVIEFHLHGNSFILNSVVSEAQLHGARAAMPGEFSFRAFQNGKLNLSQAESVSDLISSKTPIAADWALQNLLGKSKNSLEKLKERIVHSLAQVEVDIDFSDQGVSLINYPLWAETLNEWCIDVEKLRKNFLDSIPLREGIRLALVGAPNSGKSSLFNKLLNEDRSIVSEEAGTTRDVVRESLLLAGLVFRISDTAGLRETANSIESQGIDRSYGELKGADLVLWVVDGAVEARMPLSEIRAKWNFFRSQCSGHFLLVWNKSDISSAPSGDWAAFLNTDGPRYVQISAKLGTGLSDLIALIPSFFRSKEQHNESFLIGRMRHYEVLGGAVSSVRSAIEKVHRGETLPDLLSSDLRAAISHLGEISGDFTNEDLLSHIFSKFCIGK
jgi:tRNA modification GTPase